MGMKKLATALIGDQQTGSIVGALDSGTPAAIDRLTKPKEETGKGSAWKPRDFDAEARGKTRCVQFEAALMSPAIAGLKFNNLEEYLKLCVQAADAGVAYTFGEKK